MEASSSSTCGEGTSKFSTSDGKMQLHTSWSEHSTVHTVRVTARSPSHMHFCDLAATQHIKRLS